MLRPWKLQLNLELDNKEVPMYQQLADKVQKLIETGTLKTGDALPGSREMSEQLHVSRKTVVSAMELLVFSGWLENRERVGLFVRERPIQQSSHRLQSSSARMVEPPMQEAVTKEPTVRLTINDGYPDTQLVPFEELSRAYRQLFNRAARWKMLGYGDARGNLKFRTSVAQEVRHERGLNIQPEEVMVTRGSQQALYLVAHALYRPGDAVAMEYPTYQNARLAVESAGLEVVPVPVDDEGIDTEVLAEVLIQHPNIRALYVTPRYQYPTTVTMSPSRRRRLAELVIEHGVMVLEDDFGCHFQFTVQHVMPLSVLLPKTHYIYIGTFSKLLAPALRMGFIASSQEVVDRVAAYRKIVDIQGDGIMERAILELTESGEIKRHLRKACRVYRERLDYISHRIQHELKDKVEFRKPRGGMALWITTGHNPEQALLERGIASTWVPMPGGRWGLRVGYASMQQEEVDMLVAALKEILFRE